MSTDNQNNQIKNALYYPEIHMRDATSIKSMALIYDKIYRLVPYGVTPDDNPELAPLLEDGSIGRPIDPSQYAVQASNEFIEKIDSGSWDAAALSKPDDDTLLSRLHSEKLDDKLRSLFLDLGYEKSEEWFDVPADVANSYMLYLASSASAKNGLDLATTNWPAWTATTYYDINGAVDDHVQHYEPGSEAEHEYSLFGLALSAITPANVAEIPASLISKFRMSRKDEMSSLRESIRELRISLEVTDNHQIQADLILSKITDLSIALDNYKKSADILRVKSWIGSTFMGFPAPTLLGTALGLADSTTMLLAAACLAIGGIYNLQTNKLELHKLKKGNGSSYLFDYRKSFSRYTYFRGRGDISHHAYNCLQEFVCD